MFREYPHKSNKTKSKIQSNSEIIRVNEQVFEGRTSTLLLFKVSSNWGKINKQQIQGNTNIKRHNQLEWVWLYPQMLEFIIHISGRWEL